MVCLASSGCSGVVLETLTFSCEHTVSADALLIVSSQIFSVINITFIGCSQRTEGLVTFVQPTNQTVEHQSAISHFGNSNTPFFLRTPRVFPSQYSPAKCFEWHDYAINMSAYKGSPASHISKLSDIEMQSSSIFNGMSNTATFSTARQIVKFISQPVNSTSEARIAGFDNTDSFQVDSSQANVGLLTIDHSGFSELKNASVSSVFMISSATNLSATNGSVLITFGNLESQASLSILDEETNLADSRYSAIMNFLPSLPSDIQISTVVNAKRNETYNAYQNVNRSWPFSMQLFRTGISNIAEEVTDVDGSVTARTLIYNHSAKINNTLNKITSANMIKNAHISQCVTMTNIFSKSMPLSSIFSKSAGWVDIGRVTNETIPKMYERFSALIQLTSTGALSNQAANSFGNTSDQLTEGTGDEISSKILLSTIVTSSPENANENANETDVFEIATNGQKNVNVLNYTSKISNNGSFQPETSSSHIQLYAVNWISTGKYQSTTFAIRNSSQALDQRSNSLQFQNVMNAVLYGLAGALCMLMFCKRWKRYFPQLNLRNEFK